MAKPRVFISHSSSDNTFASLLVEDLNAAGAKAWMDVSDLGAGNFQEHIGEALANCEWFVLVLTQKALESPWVRQEVDAANRLKHRGKIRDLIFIRAEPVTQDEMPVLWGVFTVFDATTNYEAACDRVLKAIGLTPIAESSTLQRDRSPSKTTIVAADDDPQMLRLVTRNLQLEGYNVFAASDGQRALEQIEAHTPDLVLLDVMMPELDGFTVCERVRESSNVPIIIVTARGQDQDKVRGLDLGADDYLTKPFSVDELLARVRAILRRAQIAIDPHAKSETTTVGELMVDHAQHLVTMRGREINLAPMEYRLLAYLAQNVGRVLSPDRLLMRIWGLDYVDETHLLQVTVNRLRRKIEADPAHPRYLRTRVGEGYLLAKQSLSKPYET